MLDPNTQRLLTQYTEQYNSALLEAKRLKGRGKELKRADRPLSEKNRRYAKAGARVNTFNKRLRPLKNQLSISSG